MENVNDFFAKHASLEIFNDINVDAANLLSAGKHSVMLGIVEPVEAKPSTEYGDVTPQLKVRFFNKSGILTRWFPLTGYHHYSKCKPEFLAECSKRFGADNVICSSDDYLVINNNGTKTRAINPEAVAQCQKRIKDLLYAFEISDSEIRDENGKASLEQIISALNERKEAKIYAKIGVYADSEGRPQMSWIGRADTKVTVPGVSDAIAAEIEQLA